MPYAKTSELPDAVKELPEHGQEIYLAAFNSAFKQYKDEGKAHGTAWAAVKDKYKKNAEGKWVAKEAVHPHGEHICYCPKCEHEITVDEDVKCNTQECPECGTRMRAKDIGERRESMKSVEQLQARYSEIIQEVEMRDVSADGDRVFRAITLCSDLRATEKPEESAVADAITEADEVLAWLREQALMKSEGGHKFPIEAYAYAGNSHRPVTWHFRIWEDPEKKVTKAQLGRLAATLSPGGDKTGIKGVPDKDLQAVKRAVRAAYRKLGVEAKDMPKWITEAETRERLLSYVPLTEASFDKGRATVIVIKAGFNADKSRYYPAEVLKRDYLIFEGLKMYADHPTEDEEKARPERSIKDWVATLKDVTCDEAGTVTGVAEVIEPWMQQKLASLRDKDMLSEMGVSIDAVGSASKANIEGVDTLAIEKLVMARSVDFVTEPGAGGIVTLYEADERNIDLVELSALKERRPDLIKALEAEVRAELQEEVQKIMEDKERITELETNITTLTTERDELKTKIDEAEKQKLIAETKALVDKAVAEAELPDAAKTRLLARFVDAESDEGLAEAIKAEVDYVAEIREAGKVRGLGGTTGPTSDLDKLALAESFRRLNPEASDEEIKTLVEGR